MNDNLNIVGHVTIKLLDVNGVVKDTRAIKNVVVTVGKNYLTSWLAAASQSSSFMPYIALGVGSSSALVSDITMQSELATRVLGSISSSLNVLQNMAIFLPGVNTGTISEVGLFSASSGGTLFAHQVFSPIIKNAADSLQVTWSITFS